MSRRFTYNEVYEYIESFDYKLLSKEYVNNSVKLKIQCNKGHVYEAKYNDFRNGHRCPYCTGRARLKYDDVKLYIENEGYTLLSKEYINSHTKMDILCPNGHEISVNFNNFKNNFRCAKCNRSKGEKSISKVLDKYGVEYKTQYIFKDCLYKKYLLFDFYIKDINLCIEYDGEQHYKIMEIFGGYEGFIETKIRDTIKTDYCSKSKINLLRIPYWDLKNIEEILIKNLNLS